MRVGDLVRVRVFEGIAVRVTVRVMTVVRLLVGVAVDVFVLLRVGERVGVGVRVVVGVRVIVGIRVFVGVGAGAGCVAKSKTPLFCVINVTLSMPIIERILPLNTPTKRIFPVVPLVLGMRMA